MFSPLSQSVHKKRAEDFCKRSTLFYQYVFYSGLLVDDLPKRGRSLQNRLSAHLIKSECVGREKFLHKDIKRRKRHFVKSFSDSTFRFRKLLITH